MLMFGSANVAEEVCHLNRWDKCSLPINALETALELRQLDTLAFFLRSRDSGMASVIKLLNLYLDCMKALVHNLQYYNYMHPEFI